MQKNKATNGILKRKNPQLQEKKCNELNKGPAEPEILKYHYFKKSQDAAIAALQRGQSWANNTDYDESDMDPRKMKDPDLASNNKDKIYGPERNWDNKPMLQKESHKIANEFWNNSTQDINKDPKTQTLFVENATQRDFAMEDAPQDVGCEKDQIIKIKTTDNHLSWADHKELKKQIGDIKWLTRLRKFKERYNEYQKVCEQAQDDMQSEGQQINILGMQEQQVTQQVIIRGVQEERSDQDGEQPIQKKIKTTNNSTEYNCGGKDR